MKIAFFTEIGTPTGVKYTRNFPNTRTDVAWSIALDATNYLVRNPEINQYYDVGFIIVPKKNPESAFRCYWDNRNKCGKWCVIQEGPHTLWQDWPIDNQFAYLQFLNNMDIIFAHNESDRIYYKGIFSGKQVETFPTLMIEDSIPEIPYQVRSGAMISGNMCSWYGGMDSFIVGQILSDEVYAPSMGRKQDNEESIEGLTHTRYMIWSDWILELNKRKYGVNLMRTFAAGSFSLACARLKIPCIGWGRNDDLSPEGLDTQRLLFPELTVPTGDMVQVTSIANHLKTYEPFYHHCAEYAFKKYNEIYTESIFIDKIMNIIK